MSLYWLFFASLTVVGSLTYNLGMKFGAGMPVFTFVLIAAVTTFFVQTAVFLTAKYAFKYEVTQNVDFHHAKYAIMAGMATALIDIAYFFALRYGSVVASQIFWTVGGSVAITVVAILFLNEFMTLSKAAGIAFGLLAVLLLTKQS